MEAPGADKYHYGMRRAPFLLFLLPALQGTPAGDDGQWTMPGRNYAATRFSGLTQITPANVSKLRAVWSFSTGVLGGHEGQPLVVGNTMYVVTPFPNVLYAFDLTREGYPLKWKYRPDVNPTSVGIACCDAINRGAVYADGKIVYNLLDGHTVAVDAQTGREVWNTQIADMGQGLRRPLGRRVRHLRVAQGARSRDRQGRVDGAQYGSRLVDARPSGNVQQREPGRLHVER